MGVNRIMQELRSSTAELHDQIEAVPFHKRLARGEIKSQEYVLLLRSLETIHRAQEEIRKGDGDGVVGRLSASLLTLSPALADDIEDGRRRLRNCPERPLKTAVIYSDQLHEVYEQEPAAILGHLYVMHGSLLGGLELRPLFLEHLQWPPEQMRYFGGLGKKVFRAWRGFRAAMNGQDFNDIERRTVVQGGKAAFQALIEVYEDFPAPAGHRTSRVAGGMR